MMAAVGTQQHHVNAPARPFGIAGEALMIVGAVVLTLIDAVRWAKRWPMPATLGTLTNDEIDRLPTRPEGS